jgi:hypothetical protein
MSSADFNKITHIHDQTPLDLATLTDLCSIFQTHGVTDKFGIQLLHRHYVMPNESLAVTTRVDNSIVATKVTPASDVDFKKVRGQLYLLNQWSKFQAYEYEFGPSVTFPHMFLADLALYILQKGLQGKVALIADSPPGHPTYEVMLGTQTTASVSGDAWKAGQDQMSLIGWKVTPPVLESEAAPEAAPGPVGGTLTGETSGISAIKPFSPWHWYFCCTVNTDIVTPVPEVRLESLEMDAPDIKKQLQERGCI